MRSNLKRWIALFSIFTILIVSLSTNVDIQVVKADTVSSLSVGDWHSLSLVGGNSDIYEFEVPQTGYVHFEVQLGDRYNNGKKVTGSWYLPVVVKKDNVMYDHGNIHQNDCPWISRTFMANAGDIVDISFTSTSSASKEYFFDVRMIVEEPASNEELAAGEWYNLHLYSSTEDIYTFTMPEDGYFSVDIQPEYYTVNGKMQTSSSWYIPYVLKINNIIKESKNIHASSLYTSGKYLLEEGTQVQIIVTSTNQSKHAYYFSMKVNVDPEEVITQSDQTISVTTKSKTFQYSKTLHKAESFSIGAEANTEIKCEKISGDPKLKISKSGKVTVSKKIKKGTHTMKVRISAKETDEFKAATKIVTIKVKIK